MKICATLLALCAAPLFAQEPAPARAAPKGDYASDVAVVRDAQAQALEQAQTLLDETEKPSDRAAIETAIKEMERSQSALDEAKQSPGKLPAAIAAQQAAYQALLKIIPREFRMSRSRNRSQGSSSAGQPNQRQLDQLEMKPEENRYETERQAAATQTPQQREQSQTAERLKELAQRQQDLNERLRELQNALQAANTDQEREEIQRQLKRLREEERQMLADVDELRQNLERSPNASSTAEARQQLEQTRAELERAAQELEKQSASQALAAGTRAQQSLQNLREDLRRRTSSQFAEQMRQLRNEARELAEQQEQIARELDSLQNAAHKALDSSAERRQLVEQLAKQQSGLTNLLSDMRAVTEQSENIEPLLSKQLYDTLRRADQRRTDNLLEMSAVYAERGLLPQAGELERNVRTNINELRQGVERAAESVLGNEADALRYAQKQLDDLSRQVERELTRTNAATAAGNGGSRAEGRGEKPGDASASTPDTQPSPGGESTNALASANGQPGESPTGGNPSPGEQRGDANRPGNSPGNQGNRDQPAQGNQPGQRGNQPGNSPAQNGEGSGQGQSANNTASGSPGGESSANPDAQPSEGGRGGGNPLTDRERLRRFTQQLGGGGGGGGDRGDRGGPITGGNYADWSDRLRDVEQALDPADLRNQLATVRERVAAMRSEFRQRGQVPDQRVLQDQILAPMTQVRVWLQQELARQENVKSLVPLDRDPVPENYSELVRKYYEKLGDGK